MGVIDLLAESRQVTVLPLSALDTTLDQHPVFARAMANGKVFLRLGGSTRRDGPCWRSISPAALRPSGPVLVVHGGPSEFQRYETATNGFGPLESAAPHYLRPSVDGDGSVLALGLDLYDESLQFLREVESMVPANSSSFVTRAGPVRGVRVSVAPAVGHPALARRGRGARGSHTLAGGRHL
jgi:hypothetical protein